MNVQNVNICSMRSVPSMTCAMTAALTAVPQFQYHMNMSVGN